MSAPAERARETVELLESAGWFVLRITSKGHYMMGHPDCSGRVLVAGTSGDPRSRDDSLAQAKRALSTS